jgi:hypothetical protein
MWLAGSRNHRFCVTVFVGRVIVCFKGLLLSPLLLPPNNLQDGFQNDGHASDDVFRSEDRFHEAGNRVDESDGLDYSGSVVVGDSLLRVHAN